MANIGNKINAELNDAPGGMADRQREPLDPVAASAHIARIAEHDALAPGYGERAPRDRVPFGIVEQQLAWPPIPGFHLHWFNDEPGRVDRAKRAGYEHVAEEKTGEPVKRVVGRGDRGDGKQAFLMKIPEQWYLEDKNAAERKVDQDLANIRAGNDLKENQYIDKSRTKVESRR